MTQSQHHSLSQNDCEMQRRTAAPSVPSSKALASPTLQHRGSRLARRPSTASGANLPTVIGLMSTVALLATVWFRSYHSAVVLAGDESTKLDVDRGVINSSPFSTVKGVRDEFHRRYGPKSAEIYKRGVQVMGEGSIKATARRILYSASNQKSFNLGFAGYSVTVGRGNRFEQSFPFVVGRILTPLLKGTFQIPSTVRNAAIGGIPSYPYAFCFDHFVGTDLQVVSWDFSMNEGKGAAVLESYLRQSQYQLRRPMVLLLDTNENRCRLLGKYVDQGLLSDALCVGKAADAVQDKSMFEDKTPNKPPGFQEWNVFGAPPKCPGKGNWHPKKMEHELIGWMMAMYFTEAVEEAQKLAAADSNWRNSYKKASSIHQNPKTKLSEDGAVIFPKPLSNIPLNNDHVTDLLFGHKHLSDEDQEEYAMKQLSCRTNFLPATSSDQVLTSIVASGLASGITADNIMQPRNDDAYKSGWVLDVSTVERDTKIKVEKCGGLGYVDLKTALYGIPDSGPLRLWLPVQDRGARHDAEDDTSASNWFDELLICEANEKRKEKACHLDTDIEYRVGGVKIEQPSMVAGAAEYLRRKTCVHVGIPPGATITRLKDVTEVKGGVLSVETLQRLRGKGDGYKDDHVGLVVDVQARPNVDRAAGACCLSHIVWENH